MSGLGGVGKTELSISVIEKLGPVRYVVWLRASDHKLLYQDLITTAEDLRIELLRFESGNHVRGGENQGDSAFYFSGVTVTELVNILKRWLKATPDDTSRILVILDDLDGLEPSQHEEYSLLFSGDALDLMYTTRDPSMADPGMLWQAVKFDVPSLNLSDATRLLECSSTGNPLARKGASNVLVQDGHSIDTQDSDTAKMNAVATRLGAVPAAITMGSHYIKDNFGLKWSSESYDKWNSKNYDKFLDTWNEDNTRGNILTAHRSMLRYRHSMLASFEVSLDRLRRNSENVVLQGARKDSQCLRLLQLLSAMDLHEITRSSLSGFEGALQLALRNLPRNPYWKLQFGDVLADFQALGSDVSINQCIAELVKVSLLTEDSANGTFLLNNLTKACALLVPTTITHEKRIVIEDIARNMENHCNCDIPDVGGSCATQGPVQLHGSVVSNTTSIEPAKPSTVYGEDEDPNSEGSPGAPTSPLSLTISANTESQRDSERRRENDRRRERGRIADNERRWSWRRSRADGEAF